MNDSIEVEELESSNNAVNLPYDDETIVWQGRPSQWVNFPSLLFWSLLIIASSIFLLLWNGGLNQEYAPFVDKAVAAISWVVIGISILNILYAYLATHYELTTITRNKIKEERGITKLFQTQKFAELSDINDINSPAPGLLALVSLGSVVIETNDADQPIIRIRAIRDREQLIADLLPIWRELKIERKGYFGS